MIPLPPQSEVFIRTIYVALRSVLALGSVLMLTSCQESAQSPAARPEIAAPAEPHGSTPAPLDLVYVCGNKFLVTNATSRSVQVTYRIAGTPETGSLTLPPGPGGDPGYSETELETVSPGVLELYLDDVQVARRVNEALPCGAAAVSMNQRFNELSYSRTTGGLRVTAPPHHNVAPPGHYLLFILNGNGVPSVAKVLRIK
jgi:hypothetical protein